MLHNLIKKNARILGVQEAKAHCDVPCGIYDPAPAIISALTVIRMVDLINELQNKKENVSAAEYENSMARYIAEKETHAIRAKEEIRIIWGDYIKAPQVDKYPKVHDLAHRVMMAGSKAKQTTSRENALEFLACINEFAELFWQSKEIKTKRIPAPYAPKEEMVYPIL